VAEIIERVRDRILQSPTFEPRAAKGTFRIAHSDVGAYVLWPKIVQAVRELAPGVRLALKVLKQAEIAPALADGQVSLAIGSYPGLPQSLFQQRLFERAYVVLAASAHPLARKTLTLRAFAAAPQIVVRAAAGVQERIDAYLARRGQARTEWVELPSYLMIPPLLETGGFLAVVPGQLADAFARRGDFITRALPVPVPSIMVRMHWHRRFNDDAGNRWLRSLIAEKLGPQATAS
jgi:DNA-binding transcriptional LysR family regulator